MEKDKILELFLALYQRVDLERQLDTQERLSIQLDNQRRIAMHEEIIHHVLWDSAQYSMRERENLFQILNITTALADNMKRLNKAKEDFSS